MFKTTQALAMSRTIICSALVFLTVICHLSKGDHIVFLHTCASYSHRSSQWPLALALTMKGHKVTFISPYSSTPHFSSPNVTDIQPRALGEFLDEVISTKFDISHRTYGLLPPLYLILDYYCYMACEHLYKSPEIKTWVASNPKVDLIIADITPDCSYGLAQQLNAKNIVFLSLPLMKHYEAFGMSQESSSIPDDRQRKPPPTFLNRVGGALLPFWYLAMEHVFYGKYKSLFETELGLKNYPDIYDVRDLTNLFMINGDYLSDYPRSLPPFFVKVEGLHIKQGGEQMPLPKDIEEFISGSEGFIYISFGTLVKPGNLPLELRQAFFNAIKAFPKIKFIWRWEGEHPTDHPANLRLIHWIDQQNLLAHPKIKGFMTQAGRPSSLEAIFYGVPTITFPVLAEQDFNSHRLEDLGSSIGLDFVGLTEEMLTKAVSDILHNPSYKEKAMRLADLARDVPMDPVSKAVWWVEFVLRRSPEDLALMKPLARHLTWYQKRDIDVWLFLGIVLVLCSYVFYILARKVLSRFFSTFTKNDGKMKMS